MNPQPDSICWVAVDWGTSRMRAWAMDPDFQIRHRTDSDKGADRLVRTQYETALLELVGGWLPANRATPIIACGMVGSPHGWVEAGYAAIDGESTTEARTVEALTNDPRLLVRIVPGLKQLHPPDVMRGEETQVRGFAAENEDFDGVLCLPGTHTKWVRVRARRILRFQTFMTGELFALLAGQSILRHTVSGKGWNDRAFANAVKDSMAHPESVASRLFSLRSEALLAGLSGGTARARLSGLLIGAELAAAKTFWHGRNVTVVGENGVAEAYGQALAALDIAARKASAEALTLAGLAAAYRSWIQDSDRTDN